MGLKESPQKVQIIAKNEENREKINQQFPNWLKDEATSLGVTTVSYRRQCSSKEYQRLQEAHRRALLLSYAPLGWNLKLRAFQSLVVSKAAYGWIGQHPPVSHANSLFSALSRNLETGKAAARELRKMFYGCITWLPFVILTRRWSRLYRALKKDRTNHHWARTPFTSTNNIRIALKHLGFVESRPWTWTPATDWISAFPNDEDSFPHDTIQATPGEAAPYT